MSVAPTTELELGRNLKPDSIVEGNDVYFECRIRCNPPPHRILWTHEVSSLFFCFSFTNWVLCLDRWDSLFFIAAPIKTYRSLRVAAFARGTAAEKNQTWKIRADIWIEKISHSKEMEISSFLLFCSIELQKDLVIQIESLLLLLHVFTEQTMGVVPLAVFPVCSFCYSLSVLVKLKQKWWWMRLRAGRDMNWRTAGTDST